MKRWQAFRKENYAHNVNVNMCGPATPTASPRASREHIWPMQQVSRAQKALDNLLLRCIIILTDGGLETRDPDAGKRSETRSPASTGHFKPTAWRGHRQTVRRGQLFRSQRSRSGQIRDAPPGAERASAGFRGGGRLRVLKAILLPGAVGIRAGRTRRPGSAQARAQAGAQTDRRSSDLHRRNTSAGPLGSTWRHGALDSPAFWHDRASAKHRARVTAPSKKTPLREPDYKPVNPPDLVANYEQLRRDSTGVSARGHEGLGLALFLRRGMKAWMQAWSQCPGHISPQAQTQAAMAAPVPLDVRMQVATVLAGIILSLQQEATP